MAYYYDTEEAWRGSEESFHEFESAHPGLRMVVHPDDDPTERRTWISFIFEADNREVLERALLDYGKSLWDDVSTPDDLEYHGMSYDDIRQRPDSAE